ncbi:MAG TPA: hypothetical protein VG755_11505 [Nannocystaceae bacterium]|nr:hypothetical protein [Nannocystaceae bacterium]
MRWSIHLLVWTSLAACGASPSAPTTVAAPPIAGSPLVGVTPVADADREFEGIVRERLPAGSYLYLAVEQDDRLRWIATTGSDAELGTRVRVQSMGVRHDFHSRRLDRSFDELVFGVVSPAANPERTNT